MERIYLDGTVTPPYAGHLHETREDAQQLNVARLDIETAISFLTTRVDKSDKDDCKKLKRVIQYLKQTINNVRIIGCGDLENLYITWINAVYGVWLNMHVYGSRNESL